MWPVVADLQLLLLNACCWCIECEWRDVKAMRSQLADDPSLFARDGVGPHVNVSRWEMIPRNNHLCILKMEEDGQCFPSGRDLLLKDYCRE